MYSSFLKYATAGTPLRRVGMFCLVQHTRKMAVLAHHAMGNENEQNKLSKVISPS